MCFTMFLCVFCLSAFVGPPCASACSRLGSTSLRTGPVAPFVGLCGPLWALLFFIFLVFIYLWAHCFFKIVIVLTHNYLWALILFTKFGTYSFVGPVSSPKYKLCSLPYMAELCLFASSFVLCLLAVSCVFVLLALSLYR